MEKRLFILLVMTGCHAMSGQSKHWPPKESKTTFVVKGDSMQQIKSFIPSNFATCNYGFFCKQELKLEKQTHVPIKFRLGSVEHTNWLEGKVRYKPSN